ncbi:MAG: hypothetical protein C5B51_04520 [Terriglobia bacterium]|nr:MAG: hypothetical protein C5B51_04520 [Terriglobia bacterium]
MRILFLSFLLLPPGAAQIVCTLGTGASSYKPGSDQRPSTDALELAARVNAAVRTICSDHCPTMALFRNATAPNAMLIAGAAQAKLVYAPQFFAAVYGGFGDNGILAIIAHLIGHALDDTLGAAWVKSSWSPELRADGWAGCVLARIDLRPAGLDPSLAALSKYPAAAHPAWNLRLPVLRTGYTQCGGDGSKFGKAK